MGFRFFAELDQDDLQDIYELTYKYGWIKAMERANDGWLPDRAYMEKAKIEDILEGAIDYGLEEMLNAYADWLQFHEREDWIEALKEHSITAMLVIFADYWKLDLDDAIVETIVDYLGQGSDNPDRYFLYNEEDPTYLAETFGEGFIKWKADQATTEEEGQKYLTMLEELSSQEIAEFVEQGQYPSKENYGIWEEFIDYIIEEQGWSLKEWVEGMGSTKDVIETFPHAIENNIDYLLNIAYDKYLERFPGLDKEIEGIRKMYDILQEVDQSSSIDEKIITFQEGLTTAHHHGTMADHLLGVQPGHGKQILDTISSGPNMKEWNKELESTLGSDFKKMLEGE